MAEEKKNVQLHFMVSESEKELIKKNMERAGISGLGAYLRKISINGYIVKLDLSDIRKLTFLFGNASNNLNQIAKRVNETNNIYAEDIRDLQENYKGLWKITNKVLEELSGIV